MSNSDATKRVCILMGTHNGAAELPGQLQSFADQTEPRWDLIVSDDGSTDDSRAIVRAFAARMIPDGHQVLLVDGPCRGFVTNFLGLITHASEAADWVALADQDDVWLPDRLARGIAALARLPADRPALYCSATVITNATLENPRPSARMPRPPGFRNALVQNITSGNTILLNRGAARLARAAAPGAAGVSGLPAHDWWLYQLITGCGGTVIRDPAPTLLYRQHRGNLIGANDGWRARAWRIGMLLNGRFAEWNDANIAAMQLAAGRLTPENRTLLDRFAALRGKPLFARLRDFAGLRLYRQGRMGQAALWLALLLRRL